MTSFQTPSETAELYSRMAALRRTNEALENARRRDQQLIIQLREQVARLEQKVESMVDEKIDSQTCIELYKRLIKDYETDKQNSEMVRG